MLDCLWEWTKELMMWAREIFSSVNEHRDLDL